MRELDITRRRGTLRNGFDFGSREGPFLRGRIPPQPTNGTWRRRHPLLWKKFVFCFIAFYNFMLCFIARYAMLNVPYILNLLLFRSLNRVIDLGLDGYDC